MRDLVQSLFLASLPTLQSPNPGSRIRTTQFRIAPPRLPGCRFLIRLHASPRQPTRLDGTAWTRLTALKLRSVAFPDEKPGSAVPAIALGVRWTLPRAAKGSVSAHQVRTT